MNINASRDFRNATKYYVYVCCYVGSYRLWLLVAGKIRYKNMLNEPP